MLRRTSLVVLTLFLAFGAIACETEKSYADRRAREAAAPKPPPVLVVRHHVGGTHHRAVVLGGVLYATFSNLLLVISVDSGTVLTSVELMPFGTCGGATEMLVWPDGSSLVVLLDGTAVVELSLADPRTPVITGTRRSNEIGFPPRSIALAGGDIWISGERGVVRWSEVAPPSSVPPIALDGAGDTGATKGKSKNRDKNAPVLPMPRLAAIAEERGVIGPVVESSEGIVAPAGRRVFRVDDGTFVGAASRLDPIPPDIAATIGLPGGFLFILQGSDAAQVGLMSSDIRQVDAKALRGTARRVRVIGSHFFAINDEEIVAFPITSTPEGPRLGEPIYVPVRGARDLDALSDNYFAVVGSFGRAFYRLRTDNRGTGDVFFDARREPSRLSFATTDRRRVLAGGPEGSWLYTIGDEVALVNQPVPQEEGRKNSVGGGWGTARVDADGRSVVILPRGATMIPPPEPGAPKGTPAGAPKQLEIVWKPRLGGEIFGVESLDGRLWIWHGDGVDVLQVDQGRIIADGSVRLEGPVRYLFPQRVGGAAAYVSEFGGFGVLDFVERAALPGIGGERVVDLDGDGHDDVLLTETERHGAGRDFDSTKIAVPTSSDAGRSSR